MVSLNSSPALRRRVPFTKTVETFGARLPLSFFLAAIGAANPKENENVLEGSKDR